MGKDFINVLMLSIWSLGILWMNIYLSYILTFHRNTLKVSMIHLVADILISATAGLITYFLAKIIDLSEIYVIMLAAIIGHLASRVAFKSILYDNNLWVRTKRKNSTNSYFKDGANEDTNTSKDTSLISKEDVND